MTKADIINEVAIATGMPKKEVGTVVEAFMEEVKKCLIEKKDNFCAAFLWKRNVCWSMHMENWKEN